eukprot:jgi/Botrbrau1/19899/Bobra.0059s0020.1
MAGSLDTLLAELFGEDSETETLPNKIEECQMIPICYPSGLYLHKRVFDEMEQAAIMRLVAHEGLWEVPRANQAMWFGDLPSWTAGMIEKFPLEDLPAEIRSRRPLFDQLTINTYLPGEGLKAHVDLPRFDDGICIVSLGSAAVMQFYYKAFEYPVLLEPGDVLLLSGEARMCWTHGIQARNLDVLPGGSSILRRHRTSLTFRRMRDSQPLCSH